MFDDILKIGRRSSANAEQYSLWGKEASKRFIEENIPLTDSVAKIASENKLNSEEVARVSEFANLETYNHKLSSASGDKSFEFPLSDPRKITAPEPEKTASLPSEFDTSYDFGLADELSKAASGDIFEAFGVSPELEKTASPKLAFNLLERLEFLAQTERDKIAAGLEESVQDAEKFYNQLKQEFLNGKSFEDISAAVKAKAEDSKYKDRLIDLLGWVKRRFVDEGILITASRTGDSGDEESSEKKAEPVEQDLITDAFESPGVSMAIVNGRHPMFATMNTLVKQFERADESKHNLIILDDKIRYVKNRIYKNQ